MKCFRFQIDSILNEKKLNKEGTVNILNTRIDHL